MNDTNKPQIFIHDAVAFVNKTINDAVADGSVPALSFAGLADVEYHKTVTRFPNYNVEFGSIFGSKVHMYVCHRGYGEAKWEVEVGTSGCTRTLEHSMYLAKTLVGVNAIASTILAFLESHEIVATPEAIALEKENEAKSAAAWAQHRAHEQAQKDEKKRLRYLKASVTRKFNRVIAAGVLDNQEISRIQKMIDDGKLGEVKALLN